MTEPINALYSREILRHTANMTRLGRLDAPDGTASAVSRMCGSKITVDVVLDGDVVGDYAQEVEACALGQCAASILARTVVGASVAEITALKASMLAMLKEGGPPPEGRFADLAILESVRDYTARHGSVMLPFQAITDAIETARSS